MRIIEPNYEILTDINEKNILKNIEKAGRVCYKSELNITECSASSFVNSIIERGHESVIEHATVSVKIICDRGITHEIVRHRIASYSQESTRFCNYSSDRFGNEITLIRPYYWEKDSEEYEIWLETMKLVEKNYMTLIDLGAKPEEARSILPNSLKTEIIVTMNLREWRHFFKMRTSKNAHPQMRQIMIPLLNEMKSKIPLLFDDIIC